MRIGERGYTLTEVIVAVAAIGILVGAIVPLVSTQVERSRIAQADSDLELLSTSLARYYADTQYWPCQWDPGEDSNMHLDLVAFDCLYESGGVMGWDGPYLSKSAGRDISGKTLTAAMITGTRDYEGFVDPWAKPFGLFMATSSPDGGDYGTVVIYSKGRNEVLDSTDADLLLGKSSGDDIVRLVSAKIAE